MSLLGCVRPAAVPPIPRTQLGIPPLPARLLPGKLMANNILDMPITARLPRRFFSCAGFKEQWVVVSITDLVQPAPDLSRSPGVRWPGDRAYIRDPTHVSVGVHLEIARLGDGGLRTGRVARRKADRPSANGGPSMPAFSPVAW